MSENKEIEKDSENISAEALKDEASQGKATEAAQAGNEDDVHAEMHRLKAELDEIKALADQNHDLALRAKAEAENTRRRVEKDVANAHKYALEKFAQDLLPIIDSMELGINAAQEEGATVEKIKEGSELTFKMFQTALKKHGIKAVDPQGEKFSPDFHQAMSMQENPEVESNTVMAVMQKGYTLQGRLVRPAMVVVSKGGATKPADGGGQIDEMA